MEEPLDLLRDEVDKAKREVAKILRNARTLIKDDVSEGSKANRVFTEEGRAKTYRMIDSRYDALDVELDRWGRDLADSTALTFQSAALSDREKRQVTSGKDAKDEVLSDPLMSSEFKREVFGEYYEAIGLPSNADGAEVEGLHIAAAKTDQMSATTIRQLREIVAEVFLESSVLGRTPREIQGELERRWGEVASGDEELEAFDFFVDKGGTRWKNDNYWNMLSRTLPAKVAREAYRDAMVRMGQDAGDPLLFDLAEIVGGGQPCPVCSDWRGVIISLSGAGTSSAPPRDDEGPPTDVDGNPLQDLEGTPVALNPDGSLTLYHRTTSDPDTIRKEGFQSPDARGEVFFSTAVKGQAEGFGDNVITLRVNPALVRLDDAFRDGELHVAMPVGAATDAFRQAEPLGLPRDFPSMKDALDAGVWHPNCVCEIVNVDRLVDAERIALQAGLPNPPKPSKAAWNEYARDVQSRAKDSVAVKDVSTALLADPEVDRAARVRAMKARLAAQGREGQAEGFVFASPNELEDMDWETARANMDAEGMEEAHDFATRVDKVITPRRGMSGATSYDAIGDWADGAEQSTVTEYHGARPEYEDVRLAAALKGARWNQKSTIPFVVHEMGDEVVFKIDATVGADDVRKILDAAGIQYRTIIPYGDDAATVYIYDPGLELLDAVEGVINAEEWKIEWETGRGEFLGADEEKGEGREDARRVYREVIRTWLLENGDDERANSVRSLSLEAYARYPGELEGDFLFLEGGDALNPPPKIPPSGVLQINTIAELEDFASRLIRGNPEADLSAFDLEVAQDIVRAIKHVTDVFEVPLKGRIGDYEDVFHKKAGSALAAANDNSIGYNASAWSGTTRERVLLLESSGQGTRGTAGVSYSDPYDVTLHEMAHVLQWNGRREQSVTYQQADGTEVTKTETTDLGSYTSDDKVKEVVQPVRRKKGAQDQIREHLGDYAWTGSSSNPSRKWAETWAEAFSVYMDDPSRLEPWAIEMVEEVIRTIYPDVKLPSVGG